MPPRHPLRLLPAVSIIVLLASGVLGTARAGGPAPAAAQGPTRITADRVDGRQDVSVAADGRVVIERDATRMEADRARYDLIADEVTAEGGVRVQRGRDTLSGPTLRLRVEEQTGEMATPAYTIERERGGRRGMALKGSGTAETLFFEGENRYRLRNATFTTCQANDPAWYLKSRELKLDYDRDEGYGTGTSFHFGGVPVFYTPAAVFPLSGERRSGFLAPTIGTSNTTGTDITLPYYFNLAPNYDDTFVPRLLGRRGLQLNNEFRYLFSRGSGALRTEYMPEDAVRGESRSAVSFVHTQGLGAGFSGRVNYNAVSDKEYFADLSSRVTQTSTDTLYREAALGWTNGAALTSNLLVQRLQTLVGAPQYNRLPQFTAQAFLPEWKGFSLRLPVDATVFRRADSDEGLRAVAYPQVQYHFLRPQGFITPKAGLHLTRYDLSERVSTGPDSAGRAVPLASLDSGLFFERDVSVRQRAMVQTLEPRLYYLWVPYRDQDDLPVFDSAPMDFGFAQIFGENLFSGQDRISNANQLTAAVTTRLVDAQNGAELVRASAGTRYYFTDQRVTLPGGSARTGKIADLLGSFTGRVSTNMLVDAFAQYNTRDERLERASLGLRYQPGHARALAAAYRFKRGEYTDVDLTMQWPIYGGVYAVGRVAGDIRADKLTDAVAGMEYNGGCWVFRLAAHRLLNTTGQYTSAYYFQFEFGGVVSVGNSPVSLLERSVVGYGRINQPVSDPVFGQQ